jgi:hypothetical protein
MNVRFRFPVGLFGLLTVAVLTPAGVASAGEATPRSVFTAAGPQARQIQATVKAFRNALGGPDNGGEPGHHATGRREINWDAVPDEQAAPNVLASDVFNQTFEPFARGAILQTPGESVQVSADGDNPSGTLPRFGNLNAGYPAIFKTFSAERLFSPVGTSNVVDLTFRIPGTDQRALVKGFGAVYLDVDKAKSSFEFYDADDQLLGRFKVPPSNNGFSFLGVAFTQPVVARVRIRYGTHPLGVKDDATHDVAVMDNFIYGEPQPLP